jgi:transposase-like protein
MSDAKELLEQGDSVAKVARRVGYRNQFASRQGVQAGAWHHPGTRPKGGRPAWVS